MPRFAIFRGVMVKGELADLPVTIYALVDPDDGTARYVGQTRDPTRRLTQHLDGRGTNPEMRRWILFLRGLRKQPRLEPIVRVASREANTAERYWIGFYRSLGALLNVEGGGNPGVGNCSRCGDVVRCKRCQLLQEAERRRHPSPVERDEWGYDAMTKPR